MRLTPGRGARPEVLLNLPVSGPPALFFVYQVFPLVDLFGAARWVEASCRYEGLDPETGRYRRFQNTVTAGLAGGTATWVWSGGVEIDEAEQFERLVMTGGTLVRDGGSWSVATPSGRKALAADEGPAESLEQLFLRDVRGEETGWQADLATAADAARLGPARRAGHGRAGAEPMKVLVANLGSTSFKYKVFEMPAGEVLAQGRHGPHRRRRRVRARVPPRRRRPGGAGAASCATTEPPSTRPWRGSPAAARPPWRR